MTVTVALPDKYYHLTFALHYITPDFISMKTFLHNNDKSIPWMLPCGIQAS